MLWRSIPILKRETGETFYAYGLEILQPFIHEGVYRARVTPELIGARDLQTMLVKKEGDEWIAMGPSPDLLGPDAHPFLSRHENEYLAVVRNILKLLDNQFSLLIEINAETDSDHHTSIVAGTHFSPRLGKGMQIYPEQSVLDHVPGMRSIDRYAEDFASTIGIETDSHGGLNGDFRMTIDSDSFEIGSEIDGWSLIATSKMSEQIWTHELQLIVPPLSNSNIIEELKFAGLSPSDRLVKCCEGSPYSENFPKIVTGKYKVLDIENDVLGGYIFTLEPSEAAE